MTTQEGNRLIAEFMGWRIVGYSRKGFMGWFGNKEPHYLSPGKTESAWAIRYYDSFFQYHTSWDWLMPVGKKIHDYLQEQIKVRPAHTCSNGDMIEVDIYCAVSTYNIESAWENMVKFIQWYNSQSKPTGND